MGMLVVFVTLAALWGVCALTARMVGLLTPAPAPVPMVEKSEPTPPTAPVDDGHIDPEIIAVIAAAVASVTGPSHRVVSIRRQSTSWEKAGRQSVLTSHRIR